MTPALLVGGQFTALLHQQALAPGHGCRRGIKQGRLSSCSRKIVLPLAAALQGAEAHTRTTKASGKREVPPGGHQEQTQACDQSHPSARWQTLRDGTIMWYQERGLGVFTADPG